MKKPTTKNIIKDWLNDKIVQGQVIIKSHEFETSLVKYGQMYWGATKLPSAYSRAWREMRAQRDYDNINIYDVVPVKETKASEGVWKLITST